MTESELNIESKKLTSEYWRDFRKGATWNFYSDKLRNSSDEVWTNPSDWVGCATECIQSNTNVVQALEILLVEQKEKYLGVAEKFVFDWYEGGAYDVHYYYEIMARLPCDNAIRSKFLSSANFKDFIQDDGWGYSNSARQALIAANEPQFLEFLSSLINEKLKSKVISDVSIEEYVLPLMVDLGSKTDEYIEKNNIERVKEFCLDYLKKDENVVDKFLNGQFDEDERQIWIGDDIAYNSWALGWNDIISDLKTKDWYWMSLFGDWWDDYGNKNLLTWSFYSKDRSLIDRATLVMQSDEHNKLDGAIAWERFKSN